MSASLLINGESGQAIAAHDRGLQYGDGLFETAFVSNGEVRFLEDHLQRLFAGCERLGIPMPDKETLLAEISQVATGATKGALKIIITRGPGGRGYRPPEAATPTRVVAFHELNAAPTQSLRLRWCETRLGRNARLAGIKHLNRLEQVLAQSEWNTNDFDEGLMMDTEGELVSATAGNVFAVREGALITPDLRFCGVQGIMRQQVIRAARELHITVTEEPLWPADLDGASEIFLTNAVRGIRSAVSLDSLQWGETTVADRLANALGL